MYNACCIFCDPALFFFSFYIPAHDSEIGFGTVHILNTISQFTARVIWLQVLRLLCAESVYFCGGLYHPSNCH